MPEFTFAPLSRDVTASTPPRGLPLQPPRRPPPTDTPSSGPAVVTAQPLAPSAEAPARGDSPADDDRRDIVLIAAAVTGSVGVLLLAVIALYCGLTRSAAAGSSNGKLVRQLPVLHVSHAPACSVAGASSNLFVQRMVANVWRAGGGSHAFRPCVMLLLDGAPIQRLLADGETAVQKQSASSADHAFTDHGGLTPIAARPPAGHLDTYATALTASSPSYGPAVYVRSPRLQNCTPI